MKKIRKHITKLCLLAILGFPLLVPAQDKSENKFINGHPIVPTISWNSLIDADGKINSNKLEFIDDHCLVVLFTHHAMTVDDFSQLETMHFKYEDYLGRNMYLFQLNQKNTILKNTSEELSNIKGLCGYTASFKIDTYVQKNFNEFETLSFRIIGVGNNDLGASGIIKNKKNPQNISTDGHHLIVKPSSLTDLEELAKSPYILDIQPIGGKPEPLNFQAGQVSRSFALHNASTYNLKGNNVVIGLGDGGGIWGHIDFQNRFNRVANYAAFWGEHSTHVGGTIFGAGIISEYAGGIAPKSIIISDFYNNPVLNTKQYRSSYGMVLTNNSYSLSSFGSCFFYGKYDSDCRFIDRISKQSPDVLHVVAAGNNGNSTLNCTGTIGYGNIAGGYQCAKNTLTVGGVYDNLNATNTSSRGPTQDGRIKPELMTKGAWVYSTNSNNNYNYLGAEGTSMSSPIATGSLALLVEQYRLLNGGSNPDGALLKALAMNTATDVENVGPDFKTGFGVLNAEKAVKALKNGNYQKRVIIEGDTSDIVISIPANTKDLKVMLYWHDTTSSVASSKSLINNLDLEVWDPLSNKFLPLVLNPTSPASVAVQGVDNINNVEQVSIANPVAGNLKCRVIGKEIPLSPQDFYLVYTYEKQGIELQSPQAGITLRPNEAVSIYYEAHGLSGGNIEIEYSIDNGANWIGIATKSLSTVEHSWTVPSSIATSVTGLFRVRHTISGYSDSTKGHVVFMPKPSLTSIKSCGKQAYFQWAPISGVDAYEVLQLESGEWKSRGYTNKTYYSMTDLDNGSQERITLRGVKNGIAGRRMDAVSFIVSDSSCNFGGDVSIIDITSSKSGRQNTSSALTTEIITINLRNNGTSSVSNIPVSYQVNSGSTVNETAALTISGNSEVSYSFTNTFNFSAAGAYKLKVWTALVGDTLSSNDTINGSIFHNSNAPLTLPFLQNFETCKDTTILKSTSYIPGASEVDFESSNQFGRLRTMAGKLNSVANRALITDKKQDTSNKAINDVILTYNLSTYNIGANVILNFDWKQNALNLDGNDSLWIRGSDANTWLPVLNFKNGQTSTFNSIRNIAITKILTASSQSTSSSTQFRFRYKTKHNMDDFNQGGGFAIDNIQLVNAPIDLGIDSILSPVSKCGNSSGPVKLKYTNHGTTTITKLVFNYSIDGLAVVKDSATVSLSADSSGVFTFSTSPTVSSIEKHVVKTWVTLSTDNNKINDTLSISFRVIPTINTFPHLEDFDGTKQTFYTEGTNSTWELGTPNTYLNQGAVTGNNAWATGLNDDYNPNEISYLTSSCYDFSGDASNIRLTYNSIFETEDAYDYYQLQVSDDLGKTWYIMGHRGKVHNGYNNGATNNYFDSLQETWKVHGFTVPLDSLTNIHQIQFRFKFFSDGLISYDGVTIDNFHVLGDTSEVYDKNTLVTGFIGAGTGWNHLSQGNQHIFSVNDSAYALGVSKNGVYINKGALRNYNNQYTLDRNWWLLPSNNTTGTYKVRLFFTEAEATRLVALDPSMADFRDIGVTKYHGINEDSLFTNNDSTNAGPYVYYNKTQVKLIPWFNGMAVEFTTNTLSEFWINGGTFNRFVPLPNHFINAKVIRISDNKAQISWEFGENCPNGYFEIHKCDKNGQKQCFNLIDLVGTSCNTTFYTGYDRNAPKTEAYYNIQWVLPTGEKFYSEIIKLPAYKDFNEMQIVPNPNTGEFAIVSHMSQGPTDITILSLNGVELYHNHTNVRSDESIYMHTQLPNGIYILRITGKDNIQTQKFIITR